jgi:O-antigen biosynthesis protein
MGTSSRAMAGFVTGARSFVARRKRIASIIERLMYRFPLAEDAIIALIRGNPQKRYELWIAEHDTLSDADLTKIKTVLLTLGSQPFFSLVVPVASQNAEMPDVLDESLSAQVYTHWEAVAVPESDVREWNGALRSASGDYVVTVDPRFVLRPHALFLFACAIARCRDLLLVYGDEDEIDAARRRSRHYFKPDWNPALLRNQHYFGGVVCYRRSAAIEAGGFEEERGRDPVWSLSSRVTAKASRKQVEHLPFILSHRIRGAGDGTPDGERPAQTPTPPPSLQPSEHAPLVSVIVPTTCGLDFLHPCLAGLLQRTSYPELEILVVVNGSSPLTTEQREYVEAIGRHPPVRVLFHDERPYNFAKTNNWAVEQASGELLCFLNDDTEVINPEWLSALVAEAQEDAVGAAGALLLYPNGRIQHAGVILGVGGVAAHAYRGRRPDTRGYHDRARLPQDVSGVTAACMLVRREAFTGVGAFDPSFATAFNDVDLCLRLREAGWRIVWTPAAQLYHKESASIGRHNLGARQQQWDVDYKRIRSRWRDQLLADPHYSPNLSLDGLEVWEPAFPPRAGLPWRATTKLSSGSRSVHPR